MRSWLPLAALLLLGRGVRTASAWPVDRVIDLEVGAEKFEKPLALAWAEVDEPQVVSAELLPSGELFLTALTPGRALVLVYAEGQFAVWRLRVAPKGARPAAVQPSSETLAAMRKACPKVKVAAAPSETPLAGTVEDDRCRQALRAVLATDAYTSQQLELTFEVAALQAQLAEFQKGLPSGVQAHYLGGSLVLAGDVPSTQHRRALWELFRRSATRVTLDDQLETPSDAGHSAP